MADDTFEAFLQEEPMEVKLEEEEPMEVEEKLEEKEPEDVFVPSARVKIERRS